LMRPEKRLNNHPGRVPHILAKPDTMLT